MRKEGDAGEKEVQLCKVSGKASSKIHKVTLDFNFSIVILLYLKTYKNFELQECIDWATDERRTFLRQSLEARLIGLFYDTGRFTDALSLGSTLLKELKKLDDKNLLVEVKGNRGKRMNLRSGLPILLK